MPKPCKLETTQPRSSKPSCRQAHSSLTCVLRSQPETVAPGRCIFRRSYAPKAVSNLATSRSWTCTVRTPRAISCESPQQPGMRGPHTCCLYSSRSDSLRWGRSGSSNLIEASCCTHSIMGKVFPSPE
jgi:hypothetical protein